MLIERLLLCLALGIGTCLIGFTIELIVYRVASIPLGAWICIVLINLLGLLGGWVFVFVIGVDVALVAWSIIGGVWEYISTREGNNS